MKAIVIDCAFLQIRCFKYSTDGLEYEYGDNPYSPPDFR
jgi:hypothetical protein